MRKKGGPLRLCQDGRQKTLVQSCLHHSAAVLPEGSAMDQPKHCDVYSFQKLKKLFLIHVRQPGYKAKGQGGVNETKAGKIAEEEMCAMQIHYLQQHTCSPSKARLATTRHAPALQIQEALSLASDHQILRATQWYVIVITHKCSCPPIQPMGVSTLYNRN
jgi:hypothetical protein